MRVPHAHTCIKCTALASHMMQAFRSCINTIHWDFTRYQPKGRVATDDSRQAEHSVLQCDTCCVVRSGSAFAICCQAPPEAAVYTPGVVRDLNSHCMSSWLWPCAAAYLHRKQASTISRWSYMPATSSLKHLILLLQCTILSSRFSCFVCWCQDPRSSIVSPSEEGCAAAHSLTAWRMMSFSFSENLPRFTSVRCRSDAHEPSCRGRPRFLPFAVTAPSPPVINLTTLLCKHSVISSTRFHARLVQLGAAAAAELATQVAAQARPPSLGGIGCEVCIAMSGGRLAASGRGAGATTSMCMSSTAGGGAAAAAAG